MARTEFLRASEESFNVGMPEGTGVVISQGEADCYARGMTAMEVRGAMTAPAHGSWGLAPIRDCRSDALLSSTGRTRSQEIGRAYRDGVVSRIGSRVLLALPPAQVRGPLVADAGDSEPTRYERALSAVWSCPVQAKEEPVGTDAVSPLARSLAAAVVRVMDRAHLVPDRVLTTSPAGFAMYALSAEKVEGGGSARYVEVGISGDGELGWLTEDRVTGKVSSGDLESLGDLAEFLGLARSFLMGTKVASPR